MERDDSPRPLGTVFRPPALMPATTVEHWLRPLVRFAQVESASGIVLLICTVAALALTNSPWAASFAQIWETRIGFAIGGFELFEPLRFWVNDGLMTIFFFVAGLEIKRELVAGELREARKAVLPVLAALGGMLAPAAIYLILRAGRPGHQGWGIPMATDIAFAVGFLALLGQRVPLGLRIILLSLAIADDIGAILVVVLFYSGDVSLAALGCAAVGLAVIVLLRGIGVRYVPLYVFVGAAVWLVFVRSGVHPAVAGVLLGLLTPTRAGVGDSTLADVLAHVLPRLRHDQDGPHQYKPMVVHLEAAAREAISPLARLEASLHPWVAFAIMPIFALANAGVAIEPAALGHPVALAVAAGLIVGKPLGIVLFSWLAVRVGLARLPTGVNWKVMLGAGCLAGIGFTMSLFIAGLAFPDELLDAGKIGTLTGSAVSALLGSLLLIAFLPGRTAPAAARTRALEMAHVD